jgi:glycosyltransferase involved in cell wall biosynthesis
VAARVTYIIPEYPTVTQTFVLQEVQSLVEAGWEVAVFPLRACDGARSSSYTLLRTANGPWHLSRILAAGLLRCPFAVLRLLVGNIGVVRPRLIIRQMYALVKALELTAQLEQTRHGKLIHAHFAGRCADVARYATALARGRYVYSVTVHAADVYRPDSVHLLAKRLEGAALVVSVSKHALRYLEAAALRLRRTAVIHCGVATARSTARIVSNRRTPSVLTVARFVDKKGWWTVLDAAKRLAGTGLTFRWQVVGDGPLLGRFRVAMRQMGLESHLEILGALSHEQTLATIAGASVFVLPCQRTKDGDMDGIPVVLMEAMERGITVITTPIAGIPELVEDGVTGLLVPEKDSAAVADAVARVLSHPDLMKSLTAAARQWVDLEFRSWRETAKLASQWSALLVEAPLQWAGSSSPAQGGGLLDA